MHHALGETEQLVRAWSKAVPMAANSNEMVLTTIGIACTNCPVKNC